MPLDAIVQHSTLGFKKLGQEGKDLPPSIILIRDQNIVPAEKIPEPFPPSLAGRYRPLCNGSAGGWRTGRNPGVGGAQRGDFLPSPKFALEGDRTRNLELLLGSLNHYTIGPLSHA
jgi:hypothetical protein